MSDPNISWNLTQNLGKPDKPRKTYALWGLTHKVEYGVYNNSLTTIERALLERVFYVDYGDGFVRPHTVKVDYKISLAAVSRFLKQEAQYTTALTAINFAETYVGRRRAAYLNAAASLEIDSLKFYDAHINAFVKAEKVNFSAKSNPAPRIIQPRGPRFIVESGRYIKPIEKKIYKSIDRMFMATTVFKGLNPRNRGVALREHWETFTKPVAVGLDAKRFDQHVSKSALQWEHSIYKMYYPGSKYFSWLMSLQIDNVGFARCNSGVIKYGVEGCRMSGDSNTALGNVLIMCSLIYTYLQQCGINGKLANDGDDCVVIMEESDLETFTLNLDRFFTDHGFAMTVEPPVRIFEQIEFCQSHPVFDGTEYIMVRDPRTAISKDCVAIKPLDNEKIFRMWCSAVGQGGMSLTGGIPVWQDFYRKLVDISQGAKPLKDPTMETGFQMMTKGMYRNYSPVHPSTRLSFYLAFGITPTEQVVTEKYYNTLPFDRDGDNVRFVLLPSRGRVVE